MGLVGGRGEVSPGNSPQKECHVIFITALKFWLLAIKEDSKVFILAKAAFLLEAINIHAMVTRPLHGLELC